MNYKSENTVQKMIADPTNAEFPLALVSQETDRA